MKKLITIAILIALLAMMISSALVVSAQEEGPTPSDAPAPTMEPTEEPTGEPAVEPTEEPTEEPTVEPTEEPTVEPTEEPTEEPTVEPTEEPTPEPTEEPTVEPTEEPTVEPTEEPTVEPTEEPTVEPTATITPTVEITVTATATPTVGAAAEVKPRAVVGSWTTEYIGVQNLDASLTDVILRLYQDDGTTPVTEIFRDDIPVDGNVHIPPSEFSNGRYAGVVLAGGPVAAIAFNVNRDYAAGDAYIGFDSNAGLNTFAQTLIVSRIYKNISDYTSQFHIQNVHSSMQDITVEAYIVGSSVPSATVVYADVEPNTSFTVDFANDPAYDAYADGNAGYAKFIGSSGNVAVISDGFQDKNKGPNTVVQNTLPGMPEAMAGTELVLPRVYNMTDGKWKSGIGVVNLSATTATSVTIEYTVIDGGSGTYSTTVNLLPNAAVQVSMRDVSQFPQDTAGSVKISTNPPLDIVGYGNHIKVDPKGGSAMSVTPAVSTDFATTKAAVPLALHDADGFRTGVNVYSINGGEVTTKWVRESVDPTLPGNTITQLATPGAGEPVRFSGKDFLPADFRGAVYIDSPASPVLVFANFDNKDAMLMGQVMGYNY